MTDEQTQENEQEQGEPQEPTQGDQGEQAPQEQVPVSPSGFDPDRAVPTSAPPADAQSGVPPLPENEGVEPQPEYAGPVGDSGQSPQPPVEGETPTEPETDAEALGDTSAE